MFAKEVQKLKGAFVKNVQCCPLLTLSGRAMDGQVSSVTECSQ